MKILEAIVLILVLIMGLQVVIFARSIEKMQDDMKRLAECHNKLADVARDICDSLNDAGIPGPKVVKLKSKE